MFTVTFAFSRTRRQRLKKNANTVVMCEWTFRRQLFSFFQLIKPVTNEEPSSVQSKRIDVQFSIRSIGSSWLWSMKGLRSEMRLHDMKLNSFGLGKMETKLTILLCLVKIIIYQWPIITLIKTLHCFPTLCCATRNYVEHIVYWLNDVCTLTWTICTTSSLQTA